MSLLMREGYSGQTIKKTASAQNLEKKTATKPSFPTGQKNKSKAENKYVKSASKLNVLHQVSQAYSTYRILFFYRLRGSEDIYNDDAHNHNYPQKNN